MISAPSEMRCSEMPEFAITRNVIASTSGIAIATTSPARRPRLTKLIDEHDRDRLEQRAGEAGDRLLDHGGLVGDALHVDADRQLGDDLRHLLVERGAEVEQVRSRLHADRERRSPACR